MGLVAAVALLVLGYRRYSRLSRREANLRVSRDRANLDLQMMSHQQLVQIRVHKQTHYATDSSTPDSLSADPMSFAKVPPASASLPPGPPSSSATDPSMAEQQVALGSGPAHSWAEPKLEPTDPPMVEQQDALRPGPAHSWAEPKPEPMSPMSAPSPAGATMGTKKRRRRRASAAPPPTVKAYTSPFHAFCLEQRPLLPPSGSRQERERRLGELPRPF